MPGMDGIEAARRIQAMGLVSTPRRIIVTAYGREEVFHEAEGAGLEGVLVKPVSPSLLFDTTIRALVGDEAPRPAATAAAREAAPASDDLGRLRGARVLLVEDNELNQQVAVELLSSADVQVDVASNGEEGVRRVQEQPVRPRADGPADAGDGRLRGHSSHPRAAAGARRSRSSR